MAEVLVLRAAELPLGQKRVVTAGAIEMLLIHYGASGGIDAGIVAVQSKCPHAKAPLIEGHVCDGRLICPWHMGTFALPTGALLEPPPMQALTTYPVRVTDGEVWVSDQPNLPAQQAIAQTSDTPVFVIMGAGAAGAMAATTLRQEGFTGRLLAIDPVTEEPVDRTQLSKMALSGKVPLEKTGLGTFEKVAAERVVAAVEELSAERGEVRLSNGQRIRFDRALLATGGLPKRLEIPGAERAHVIRHPEDVAGILKAAETAKTVAIAGTSFIGLEAASALVQKGLQVTVVGRETLPFEKRFGKAVAEAMMALHRSKGTTFRLGVEIVEVTGDSVVIADAHGKQQVPADMVIFGVGVEPDLGFAHDLPLAEKGGGLRTDGTLRAKANVWVAGDLASVDGTRIEHWRLAQQHGRVAARGMLGQDARYDGVPFFWTFHFGKRIGYLGHATEWDEVVSDGDVAGLEFVQFFVKSGKVEAVLTCGRDHQTAVLAEVLRGGAPTLEVAQAALSR